jgi:hypothetical protein
MKWMERQHYLYLGIALLGVLLACYAAFSNWRLRQDRPQINWEEIRKLPPREAADLLNTALNGPPGTKEMESLGAVGMLITLFFGSVGLGLLLRSKNFTAKGIIRSGAVRWRIWLPAGIVLAVIIFTWNYEKETYALSGLIKGETFFDGRPSSYWRDQFKDEGQHSFKGSLRQATIELFTTNYDRALPLLRETIHDSDKDTRWVTVYLMGECGKASANELPLLTAALRDPKPRVRFYAIPAVAIVAPDAATALAAISPLLTDNDINVSRQAVHCYCQLDPQSVRTKFKWQEFVSKEWGFRSVMPPEVTQEQRTLEGPEEHVEIHSFKASFHDALFVIAIYDYPAESPRIATEEERINRGRDLLLENTEGRLLRDEVVSQNGLSGRELIVHTPLKGVALRSRTFWKQNRMYHLLVTTPGRQVLAKQVDLFLDSFALLETAKEQ